MAEAELQEIKRLLDVATAEKDLARLDKHLATFYATARKKDGSLSTKLEVFLILDKD